MSSNNLDVCTNNVKACGIGDSIHDIQCKPSSSTNVLKTNINIDSLDIVNIKRETYYKMKFIINSLEKNWAIKKRKTIFYLKNLEDSTTEIITEDYLNKRIIHKIYNSSNSNNSNNNGQAQRQSSTPSNLETIKKKEDIIPLKEGIHTLKQLIDKGKLDINSEQKNDMVGVYEKRMITIFLGKGMKNKWRYTRMGI